jgi:hypothetical protein
VEKARVLVVEDDPRMLGFLKAVARAVSGASIAGLGEGCAASGTSSEHSGMNNPNRRRDPPRTPLAFDCGQLRHPQTSPCEVLAPATSAGPCTFNPDVQFLVELGGAVVSRTESRASPPGQFCERPRTHLRYQNVPALISAIKEYLAWTITTKTPGVCVERNR